VRFSTLLAVVLFGAPLVAAPVPKGAEQKPLYFPTAVGAKWVYETPDGELETAVVSAVEKGDDGALTVSRAGADGTRVAYTKTVVTANGLRRDDAANGKSGWLLKTNVKAGDSWDSPDGKRTVYGPEEVKVPAGTFTALRVEWEQFGASYASWYAPGVGEVKRVAKVDGTETVTRALKAFRPAAGK
jgi:hypothetical protein